MSGIEEDSTGLYGLCVFDAESTTDEEVYDIFGKFGSVEKTNRSSNLLFVRYSTLEEAEKCYYEMQEQTRFRVRPAKKKNSSDKSDFQRKDRFGDHKPSGEMSYRKFESGRSSRTSDNAQSVVREMPNLKFDVPSSQLIPAAPAGTQPKEFHRVIISHLHPYMKQSDIYLLCTKAQAPPVHVDMKTYTRSPYPTEHYAIVHVMNEADVRNIVRGLNNVKINGYQLIVAPYETLVEEGKPTQSH